MKSRIKKANFRQIIKISLIMVVILIISLSIYNNNLSINPTSSINYNLPEWEENNDLNSKYNPPLYNTYASGITSSVNNDNLIIHSTCSILGIIGLSEFNIILKRKKDKNSDASNDKASTISSLRFENLDSKEYIVLEVVKEYLSKNRSFDKDAVVRYTVSRFANKCV